MATCIAESAKAPSELSLMHLYPIDGAVHRVAKDETEWGARDATLVRITRTGESHKTQIWNPARVRTQGRWYELDRRVKPGSDSGWFIQPVNRAPVLI